MIRGALFSGPFLRRVGWGLSDQTFSSLTNFVLGALVARSVSPDQFGAFSLAFATYTLFMSVSRAIASEPLVIRKSAVPVEEWSRAAALSSGVSIVFGTVAGIGCMAVGSLLGGTLGLALLPLGITLPGLLLQDAWRSAFFARGKGAWSLLNDFLWAALMFPSIGILLATGRASVSWLVLAWGGAATAAAVIGIIQSRVAPRPFRVVQWWREQRDLIPPLLGEVGVMTGARQISLYGIGAIAGLGAVGGIRGALLLLGPLNILFMGIRIMAVPEAVRVLKTSPSKLNRGIRWLFGGLMAVTMAWAVVLFLLPRELGIAVLGETWEPARRLIIPLAIADAAHGGQFASVIGLRALAAVDRSFRTKTIVSVLQVVASLVGAFLAGAAGAAWGRAASQLAGSWIFFREFNVAIGQHRSESSTTPVLIDARLAPAVGSRKE